MSWTENTGKAPSSGVCFRLLRLETQLAAGGRDVMAFFTAKRGDNAVPAENLEETLLPLTRRALPFQSFDRVVRNQVHFRGETHGVFGQQPRLVVAVVDLVD